ncbi:apurinic endonuclease Apn1 [Desulfofarcimen acetoxidans DSM 771]|uniref:Probable endonuclease 4 n=1 Tax=Desulfofarcimen acetoxidans (strain ATCC 49208 / DSM 771 / KCTC 5769 / VKM B-1644 / 5575) TaxID=485916 RepID=C8VWW8_DESAS|nr:deoxyribonuclease IV [Desulfofarcimen acetoxidans]ACV62544.1 apurinic endonuclease Apn1 [Desulfofarcimen acetoxidans DSM 771]
MLNIGCHLSVSKGYKHLGLQALSIGANTFQFFTRNPRGSKAKQIDVNDVAALLDLMQEHQFAALLGHAPYTMNPCSNDPYLREFARAVMVEDLAKMEYLPNNLYNFHPGSHVGQGVEAGIGFIAELLNQVMWSEQTTTVLLETMSGKGSEVGSSFDELSQILKKVNLVEKMGVCLDTCHVYSAGYDIVNNLDGVLEQFDKSIGIKNLKAIHLNDSMTSFNSKKDRHALIGAGTIGAEAIADIINHPQLRNLPFYLETPNDVPGYAQEIKLLREVYGK